MKFPILVSVCIMVCLIVLPAAGTNLAIGVSAGAATTENPTENVSVFISDAKTAVADRNWTNALLLTTRGLAWYPDNADLLCLQGYTYRKTGQYQKSVDVISRGILLDPKPIRFANRGYGYLALRNYSAALADAEAGIAADAGYPADYGVKALALQGMGKNTAALADIDMALALAPGNAHYWHVKGNLLAVMGNCTGAATALEKSLEIDPDYDLPYPGFAGARGNLAALNTTCTPAPATALPAPTKSPSGFIAAAGALGAMIALGMRK